MPNGILIIDKPAGWTSMDVCAKVRGIFHEKRVGHGGTLDPMATGVLPVFVGQATRAVEFAENGRKEYVAGLRLGLVTDTQDITGTNAGDPSRHGGSGPHVEAPAPAFWESSPADPPYVLRRQGRRAKALRPGPEGTGGGAEAPAHHHLRAGAAGAGDAQRITCSAAAAPRAPTSAPSAMTSARPWAAAGPCTPCAAPWRLASVWSRPSRWRPSSPKGTSLLLPTDRLFADYPACLLPSGRPEKRVRCGNPITLPGTPDGTYRVYGQDRRVSLPVPGAGRTSHVHQEFLWSVTLSMKEKVIALGFFDGVHLGHAALLRRTVEEAARRGVTPAVFTFDRPPKEVVTGIPCPLINSPEDRRGPGPAALWHPGGADGPL